MRRGNTKSAEEIELLRLNNQLVSSTLAALAPMVKPGVTTRALDTFAEEFIRDHGAVPGFKGYQGFPYTLCVSVNEVVVHGMPSAYELQEGDVVSIDCGTVMHGYYGDSAYTFLLDPVREEVRALAHATLEALELGIKAAVCGNRTGDIGYAIQSHVQPLGYGVVREMVGHGIGRTMHEEPSVPNYGRVGSGTLLREGMVLCIEPMITLGAHHIVQERDGWTIRTRDKCVAVHYEKAVVIRAHGPADELTSYGQIERALGITE